MSVKVAFRNVVLHVSIGLVIVNQIITAMVLNIWITVWANVIVGEVIQVGRRAPMKIVIAGKDGCY